MHLLIALLGFVANSYERQPNKYSMFRRLSQVDFAEKYERMRKLSQSVEIHDRIFFGGLENCLHQFHKTTLLVVGDER